MPEQKTDTGAQDTLDAVECLEGAMQFAGNRSMAVSSEWVRGWDDCLNYMRATMAATKEPKP